MTRRHFATILRLVIPLVIIVWLVASLDRAQLEQLGRHRIHWPLLGCGFGLALLCVCTTFVRWYLLVRALGLPFRLAEAFRLSFIGYLLSFVTLGSAGGDLFKAVFIARRHPGRRPEAVATVVLDRAVGFYSLLVVASVAILFSASAMAAPIVGTLCKLVLLATLAGTVTVVLILIPGSGRLPLLRTAYRIPRIGPVVQRLAEALGVYREKRTMLAVIAAISLAAHVVFAISFYLVAASMFPEHPTQLEHFIIVPLSLVAGALPFTPAGLGTFEAAMRELYRLLPAEASGDGFLVALVFRLMTIVIAAVGVVYYWLGRREVGELLREAERENREDEMHPAQVGHVSS